MEAKIICKEEYFSSNHFEIFVASKFHADEYVYYLNQNKAI